MAILNDEAASAGAAVQSMMHALSWFRYPMLSPLFLRQESLVVVRSQNTPVVGSPESSFLYYVPLCYEGCFGRPFSLLLRGIYCTREKKKNKARGTLVDAPLLRACAPGTVGLFISCSS